MVKDRRQWGFTEIYNRTHCEYYTLLIKTSIVRVIPKKEVAKTKERFMWEMGCYFNGEFVTAIFILLM